MEAAGKPLEQWQRDAVELMMSTRPDGKWCCYEYCEWVARQNGKGGLGEARALTGFLVLGEELIIWSAHEYKTAMEAFRRMRSLIRALGEVVSETLVDVDGVMVKISNTNGEEGFERLDNGQRIKFVARSKSSGRGFSGDVNVIDEAFAFTSDQQDALMPTLIARPNAQIIYLSSPPLTGDAGEVMYELKDRGERGGDDSLGYRDWGIEGDLEDRDKMNLDDHQLWAQANPALGLGRVTLETIQRLRKAMSAKNALGFAREVLGLWPRRLQGGGAINMADWAKLLDADSVRDGDIAVGVDIAPERDYAAIGMYGVRSDGIGHLQIVDYRPGTDWILSRLGEIRSALNPVVFVMGRAVFASLEADLEKAGFAKSVDVDQPKYGDLAVTSSLEMSAATGNMLDAVRQGSFRHKGQQELDSSAAGAKTKLTGDTLVWARKDSAADTCPLVAVSLARWGYESRAHLVRAAVYDVLESVW
ncbi:MAG: hypothetical protein AUG44_08845 [Actinobacteria bacterium 13_1_20CM_3_71_11]|nr:MAG: hypothetical protein AUG44_08845 [Actinobacteria bacterium 13_1_20CM_3_71_11]